MHNTAVPVILGLIFGYICGSIPFGFLVAKIFKGVDIREKGSGNIGATNAWRTLGPAAGFCVFLMDVLKGLVPTYFAAKLGSPIAQLTAGLGAILGHTFCPFLKFKGGRGVATGLGFCLALVPGASLAAAIVWALVLMISRWVSMASCFAAIGMAVFVSTVWPASKAIHPYDLIIIWPAAIFIVIKHKPNMLRIKQGTEPKVRMPWIKK